MEQPGHPGLWASMKGIYDSLKALRDGEAPDDSSPRLASPELRDQVLRKQKYNDRIKSFLS